MAVLAPAGGMGRASLVDRSMESAAGTEAMVIVPHGAGANAGGGALPDVPQVAGLPAGGTSNAGNDAIARIHSLGAAGDGAGSRPGLSSPWKPARPVGSGGGALPPRGGSGSGGAAGSYARLPRPRGIASLANSSGSSSSAASASSASALLATLGLNGSASSSAPATTITRNAPAASLRGGSAPASPPSGGIVLTPQSAAFTLVTLDYNDGSVFVPGAEQLATPGGSVDLRAQVIDSASGTYTYSWNTSGLTDATSISGTSSYDLTFQWNTTIATAKAESVTLTVTDPNSNQVSQTYTFWVPATTGTATGGTTWPSSLDPGLISAGAPSVASQNVSVASATGAALTSISLPSFNPNVEQELVSVHFSQELVSVHFSRPTPARIGVGKNWCRQELVSARIGVSSFFAAGKNWCQFIFRGKNWCQFIFRGRPRIPKRTGIFRLTIACSAASMRGRLAAGRR